MRKLALFVCVFSLACLLWTGMAAGWANASGVMVYGFVHDRDGIPVANATVTLYEGDARLITLSNPAVTDSNGYFQFEGIDRGQYCVVYAKGDYSSPETFLVQGTGCRLNLTLWASASELSSSPSPSPSPAARPTPMPAPPASTTITPTPSPAPAPSPGFEALVAILAICLVLARRQGSV